VIITLRRLGVDQNSTSGTLAILDSNDYSATNGFQTQQKTLCRTFAFLERSGGLNAYFLEVQLIKKTRFSHPAFAAVHIRSEDRLC
jgi:hypothetical protein